jgi:hypothetical protein
MEKLPIQTKDYIQVCDNLKKRICKILYLREDVLNKQISRSDLINYINALVWDIYGCYITFDNYKFLNCICELEGIKNNLEDEFVRKKTLDLANFISNIPKES